MSYEVANTTESLGQFASNCGYSDLIAATEDYPVLVKFFETGETEVVDDCVKELRKVATDPTQDADVMTTAAVLADLIDRQELVVITDGTLEDGEVEKKGNPCHNKSDGRFCEVGGVNIGELSAQIDNPKDWSRELNQKFSAVMGSRKLSEKEGGLLADYRNFGYEGINLELRSGKPGADAKELVALVDRHKLPVDTRLWRGAELPTKTVNSLRVGTIFTDRAILSTTVAPHVALDAAFGGTHIGGQGKTQPVLFSIRASKGTTGVAMIKSPEQEVLLGARTRLKITDIQKVPASVLQEYGSNRPVLVVTAKVLR